LLAVHGRYSTADGDRYAAALTFQAFLTIFPLLLVAVAVVGYLAQSGVDVAGRAVRDLGLTGDAANLVTDAVDSAAGSRRAASVIGLLGFVWAGLGLAGGLEHAINHVWGVNDRGIRGKLVGLVWLAGAGVALLVATSATALVQLLPGVLAPVGVLAAVALNFGLWLWTFRVLPNVTRPWRQLIPGALVGAIGLEVLKIVGAYYVPRAVASSSELFGSLGVVFAILAWMYLCCRLVLYAAVVNAMSADGHSDDQQKE
jgi:membrane protein